MAHSTPRLPFFLTSLLVVAGAPSAHAFTLQSNSNCAEIRISGVPKVVLHVAKAETQEKPAQDDKPKPEEDKPTSTTPTSGSSPSEPTPQAPSSDAPTDDTPTSGTKPPSNTTPPMNSTPKPDDAPTQAPPSTPSDEISAAMAAVHGAFAHVGGTTAGISELIVTTAPFSFGAWYGDTEPTIHVGFDPEYPNRSTTKRGPKADCVYHEAHILFADAPSEDWTFDEPGDDYFMLGMRNEAGQVHFRISYLHQLLHAFGLANSNDTFSMLNHQDRSWTRGPSGKLRLAPDDARGLAHLYPGTGLLPEVALFNSWFVPKTNSSAQFPAANRKLLCAPSLGDFRASQADTCGTGGTIVTPGEMLKARVAVANYNHVHGMNGTVRVWFSADAVLSEDDVMSPTEVTVHTGEPTVLADLDVEVPDGGALLTAYVIFEFVGRTGPFPASAWIPSRGAVLFAPAP